VIEGYSLIYIKYRQKKRIHFCKKTCNTGNMADDEEKITDGL